MIKRTPSIGDSLSQLNIAPRGRAGGRDDAPGLNTDPETPEHKRAQRLRSTASSSNPFAWTGAMRGDGGAGPGRRDARYLALIVCGLVMAAIFAARLVRASFASGVGGTATYRDASIDIMCGQDVPRHVVIVDAGSTGCRAHTFEIVPGATKPRFQLRTLGKKVKGNTPLASLAGKRDDDVAEAIVPMLTQALEKVPSGERGATPLYLWATAGVRVLPDETQRALWASVARVVSKRTGFSLGLDGGGLRLENNARSHFRTIDGEEEGFFAWLAANQLSGRDMTSVGAADAAAVPIDTVGALDVGGGSAQIVALPASRILSSGDGGSGGGPPADLDELKTRVYVRSYLGYGANHVEKRMWAAAAAAAKATGKSEVTIPCAFVGRKESVDGVSLVGGGDFDACVKEVRAELHALQTRDGSPMRAPADVVGTGTRFLAMSLTYHLTHFLHVALPSGLDGFPRSTIEQVRAGSQIACGTTWEDALAKWDGVDANTATDRLPGRCFDGALVTALLEGGDGSADGGNGRGGVGFGFATDTRDIEYVEDVNGADVEWTMGAAMSLVHPARAGSIQCDASNSRSRRKGGDDGSAGGVEYVVALMIFIGAFVVFVLVKGPGMDVHIPMVVPKAGGFRKGGGMRGRSASFNV